MKRINLDANWTFRRGFIDSLGGIEADSGITVNLPHDGMIGKKVTAEAEARSDSGYFPMDVCNYTKNVFIPAEWEKESVGLYFDGAMMHASIDVNGCKVGEHHYGYTPFYLDLTNYVNYGEENRITINMNTGTPPSSRWYTGSGLFRSVELCHGHKVHIVPDGVFIYTKEIAENTAFLEAQIELDNTTTENRMVEVTVSLQKDGTVNLCAAGKRMVYVKAMNRETARIAFCVDNPMLWDCDNPNLYKVTVTAADTGIYRTHRQDHAIVCCDEAETIFGIRTITADARRGLRINGKTVKLKGGCIHHDNGLLGAVSLYESEARRIRKLKEIGFNAVRTAHNPPSRALVEACDRVGMYIMDEAFDAWRIAKRTGDYSLYFDRYWEEDLSAFVRRDRIHPSVILWSTGNEIPERGGFYDGYALATKLAETVRRLDATRPVTHGICSLWAGLDDQLARGNNQNQNASDAEPNRWETITEPFTNGLDIVGYNYMEDLYEKDHEIFPDRVMLGSENFPQMIGFRWPLVESLPYVIGEFTWTAWDYIGEAGIGKAVYVDEGDPILSDTWSLMPPGGSPFPWRLANDADVDINGEMRPQGAYRSVVWGSEKTYLFSLHPDYFGKIQVLTLWGFPAAEKNWNYREYTGQPIDVIVFSNAQEVALVVNGKEIARKAVSAERPFPNSVHFKTVYCPGIVEAVSYRNGKEISRDRMQTSGMPAGLRITAEKEQLRADGHDLSYVNIEVVDENNLCVTDACISLTASVEGCGLLAGFGSANPKTDEDYTDNRTVTFRGKATAIIRSGYETGETVVEIKAEGMEPVAVSVNIL